MDLAESEWLCDKAKAAAETKKRKREIVYKKESFANENYICPDCGGRIYLKSRWFDMDMLHCRDCNFNCLPYSNSDGMA